ncbi:MAG: hypothetical protein P8X67_06270 [Syntrophobacterales bacterium]
MSGLLLYPCSLRHDCVICWQARIFHESLAATTDMAVLPGVLGCRPQRRAIQVRLGTNPAVRFPGGTPIFVVSRQQFVKYPRSREGDAVSI